MRATHRSLLPWLPLVLLSGIPLALSRAPASTPAVGPPTICHPIRIGAAASLPWGERAFEHDPGYDRREVVQDTLVLLDLSRDTSVHMETLRRAVLYVTGTGQEPATGGNACSQGARTDTGQKPASDGNACSGGPRTELLGALTDRLERADRARERGIVISDRDRALLLFDLGYYQAALGQVGSDGFRGKGVQLVLRASDMRPEDGAMHLGAALASAGHGEHQAAFDEHLWRSCELAGEGQPLLRRNLVETIGPFLGVDTYDELLDEVRSRRGC